MKKFVALVLAILTLTALCVPAMAATTGTYNTAAVHLRSTIGGTSLGLVNKGTTCTILGEQTSNSVKWYKVTITSNTNNGGINLKGKTGWSQAQYITTNGTVSGGGISSATDAFGSANLKQGDVGNYVRNVQLCLTVKGYDIAIDGDFGPATDTAVRSFQSSKGLSVDGIVGSATKNAFWNDTACQNALKDRGY